MVWHWRFPCVHVGIEPFIDHDCYGHYNEGIVNPNKKSMILSIFWMKILKKWWWEYCPTIMILFVSLRYCVIVGKLQWELLSKKWEYCNTFWVNNDGVGFGWGYFSTLLSSSIIKHEHFHFSILSCIFSSKEWATTLSHHMFDPSDRDTGSMHIKNHQSWINEIWHHWSRKWHPLILPHFHLLKT